ncbi:MAG: carbohydrate kinase family protein [Vulcanimicrobiota bacterium]
MSDMDVAVIGNAGIDTNIYPYSGDIDFSVESNFTRNIDNIGQAGGYAALGFSKLGYRVSYIGYTGDDYSGRYILERFRSLGIDVRGVFIDPQGTARSINFMYADGRRKNFYDGKDHMNLKPDLDSCMTIISSVKAVHFNIPNWARYLLPAVKACGIVISTDLQDIVSKDDEYRKDFVQYSDILFFSSTNYPDPHPLFEHFLSFGSDKILIAGLGSRGCAVCRYGNISHFPAVSLPEPVIDTNGAGDSLAVGFLSSFVLEGFSLEDSILRGQIAARYACSSTGSNELISREKLEQYFRAAGSL